MASIQNRVVGALRLDAATFEDVERDRTATGQAALVVLAGAISGGLGTGRLTGIVLGAILGLAAWAVAAYVLMVVGTRLLPGKNTEADFGQLARTIGFAQAPNLLGVLAIIPILGYLIQVALSIWVLVAMVIAVRQALDYEDTFRAVVVCVIAWVIIFVVTVVVATVFVGTAVVGSGL